MAINFNCSQCSKALFAQERFAGRTIRCPQCSSLQSIPTKSNVEPSSPELPAVSAAAEVSEVLVSAGLTRCVACHKVLASQAQYCRYCKSFIVKKYQAVVANANDKSTPKYEIAPVLSRVAAFLIDWILVTIYTSGLFSLAVLGVYSIMNGAGSMGLKVASGFWMAFSYMLVLILPLLLFTFQHYYGGQTVGKWLLKIRVIRRKKHELMGLWHALARTFGSILSAYVLGLGYVSLFFDRERRTLPDFICDTVVTKEQLGEDLLNT